MTITRYHQQQIGQFWTGDPTAPSVTPMTFTFDVIPVGLVVTGSLSFTIAAQIPSNTSQGPIDILHNDLLKNLTWTLFRNGFAEHTWTGYGMLNNFQAFGNDKIQIIGYFSPTFNTGVITDLFNTNPVNIYCWWTGYCGNAGEMDFVIPFVSASQPPEQALTTLAPPNGAVDILVSSVSASTAGSTTTIIPEPGTGIGGGQPAVQLWSIHLSAGVTSASAIGGTITVNDSNGHVFARLAVLAANGNPADTSTDTNCHGVVVWKPPTGGADPFPIVLTLTSAALTMSVACTVYYSHIDLINGATPL